MSLLIQKSMATNIQERLDEMIQVSFTLTKVMGSITALGRICRLFGPHKTRGISLCSRAQKIPGLKKMAIHKFE
jgi:hypothetical protein